jgi:hypothetical protein
MFLYLILGFLIPFFPAGFYTSGAMRCELYGYLCLFVFFFVFLGPPFAHFEPGLSSSPGVKAAQFIREIPCWQHG